MRQFAREQIHRRIERVEAEIARVLGGADDVEAIHDLRVSIRRLRAGLRLLRPLFREGRTRRLNRALRERMRLAGEVRNRDIAAELVRESGVAAGEEIARQLAVERAGLAQLLRETLAATPELKLPKPSSPRRARCSPWREVEDAAANASRVLPRLARGFFLAGDRILSEPDRTTPQSLHALRLAAKRFRYGLELFTPLYGPALERRLGQLKTFQTILGDLNDLHTALGFEAVSSSGEMTAWIESRQAELQAAFQAEWERAARPAAVAGWRNYLARFARTRQPASAGEKLLG